MFQPLKRHPLPIEAYFEHCLVLTYALPSELLQDMLPPGLEVDSYGRDDRTGFVAVAMVQTRALRPAGVPAWCGQDFFLTGYRIFTRFRTPHGRSLRGLRILRSDTDRRLMVCFGNLLTHYNYRPASIEVAADANRFAIRIATPQQEADLHVEASLDRSAGRLPSESCFPDVRVARQFAGPLPYTFDYEPETQSIIAIRGNRRHWLPQIVDVDVQRSTFFENPPFDQVTPKLAAAFHVHDIPYRWEKGTVYQLRRAPQ